MENIEAKAIPTDEGAYISLKLSPRLFELIAGTGTFICIFGRKICKKLLNRTSSNSLRTGGLPLGDITLFGGKGDADLGDGTAIEAILFCIATLVDLG